jgi:hypothetical protein
MSVMVKVANRAFNVFQEIAITLCVAILLGLQIYAIKFSQLHIIIVYLGIRIKMEDVVTHLEAQ